MVAMWLAPAGLGGLSRLSGGRRRCGWLWHPRRAMPVVSMRLTLATLSGLGGSRRRRGWLWHAGRTVPMVTVWLTFTCWCRCRGVRASCWLTVP
jgi:hypothetical protein